MEPVRAKLSCFLADDPGSESERYEAFQAGGGGMVRKEDTILNGAEPAADGEGLAVTFTEDGGSLEATVAALDLPESWDDFDAIRADVHNEQTPVTLRFVVLGARCRLIARKDLAAGETATLSIDLVDLPLAQAARPPYEPTGLRIECQWGDTWATEGELLRNGGDWEQTSNNDPTTVRVLGVSLIPSETGEHRPAVDMFGQRRNGTWPTKVRDPEHMKQVIEEEGRWLAETPIHANRDRYGGWTGGPRFEATGFFRVQQDEGRRWWYVDPEGNPFWSIGTTGVRTTDCTVLTDREHLFENLPDRDGPLADAYNPPVASRANHAPGKETIAFYRMNVLRKWGTLEAWCRQVTRRFPVWGFNTIGNWSEQIILDQEIVPHTRALNSRIDGAPTVCHRMPDVWDSHWLDMFARDIRDTVTPVRENPWLVGYFCDNEMPWGGLHRNILECAGDSAARDEFLIFLREHYDTVGDINRDFGTSLEEWEDVREMAPEDIPEDGPGEERMREFVGIYAERYFSIVSTVIKRYDPNHLYLGCRFVRRRPHDLVCAAAGRHSDVVTVNMYSLTASREEFGAWHEAVGRRPIQIGEHHLPLFSERQVPPLYPAFTPEERRVLYVNLVRDWAQQPYSLGCHWYQHADQHVTGRPTDGENQPVGFVDITDSPYPELVEAAREATAGMYEWHATSR